MTANMSAKSVRMSKVALSAGVMAIVWLVLDEYTDLYISAALVSAVTSLVMLIAQFYDFKFKAEGGTPFEGDKPDG